MFASCQICLGERSEPGRASKPEPELAPGSPAAAPLEKEAAPLEAAATPVAGEVVPETDAEAPSSDAKKATPLRTMRAARANPKGSAFARGRARAGLVENAAARRRSRNERERTRRLIRAAEPFGFPRGIARTPTGRGGAAGARARGSTRAVRRARSGRVYLGSRRGPFLDSASLERERRSTRIVRGRVAAAPRLPRGYSAEAPCRRRRSERERLSRAGGSRSPSRRAGAISFRRRKRPRRRRSPRRATTRRRPRTDRPGRRPSDFWDLDEDVARTSFIYIYAGLIKIFLLQILPCRPTGPPLSEEVADEDAAHLLVDHKGEDGARQKPSPERQPASDEDGGAAVSQQAPRALHGPRRRGPGLIVPAGATRLEEATTVIFATPA